jgi:thiamine phosphate synthase YjbQ (UPF0047 family)
MPDGAMTPKVPMTCRRTLLTATSLHIPVLSGELALGTWQAIYLIEHRARPHRREIVLQFTGATA